MHRPKSIFGISLEKYCFSRGVFRRRDQEVFSPEELFGRAELVKDSRTVSAGIAGMFFIKRYNTRTLYKKLKRALQYPRAFRSLAAACALEKIQIPTPSVIAASRYYLVTEVLPEKTVFLHAVPEKVIDFVPVLVKIHQHNFLHGDLSLRNIYLEGDHFGLIDLDSARICTVSSRMRLKELARLTASKAFVEKRNVDSSEMERFRECYVKTSGCSLNQEVFRKECLALREEYRKKYGK